MRSLSSCVLGLGLAWTVVTGATGSSAELPLRLVPQLGWPAKGVASPDGTLFAAISVHGGHAVELVSKRGELVWSLPLVGPQQAAFSPDGKWLLACGGEEGFLLDLTTCQLVRRETLAGYLCAFTSDSEQILVVRHSAEGQRHGIQSLKSGLFVYDLTGTEKRQFDVGMEVPQWLKVIDAKTVHVHGAHGNPSMHVLRMGKAMEAFHLGTGKSERDYAPAERGGMPRVEDPSLVELPKLDDNKLVRQRAQGLAWSEAAGLCAHFGSGRPEGGVAKAWDIRHGRFLGTLGTQNNVSQIRGFAGPESILCRAWIDRKPVLALMDVRSKELKATGLTADECWLAPDGKSVLLSTEKEGETPRDFALYHLPAGRPLHRLEYNPHAGAWIWSRDGKYLAYVASTKPPVVRIVATSDGKSTDVDLSGSETTSPPSKAGVVSIWRIALDDAGNRLAVSIGGTDRGRVVIVGRESGKVEKTIEPLPDYASAVHFLGTDRLLAGFSSGTAQLWDLTAKKSLWTAETKREIVQFDTVPGGAYLVCGHMYRGGTVLRRDDGKIVYRTANLWNGDSAVPLPWTQPQLVGRGNAALEMDAESMQLRLIDLDKARAVLTYCALPDNKWIIFTPEGDWDGSAAIEHSVKFFVGLKAVAPAEIERHHRRKRIDAITRQVLSDASTPATPPK